MKNHSKTFTQVSKRKMIEQGLNVIAGVDLGDKHSQLCLINLDGNIVERKKLRASPAALERYFGGWAAMRLVLEAGAHANWVYRLLERLAELGLRMPAMLNAVEPCSLAIQCDRAVLKARETLVETRTKLINTVRGVVKSFGERLPASAATTNECGWKSGRTSHQLKVPPLTMTSLLMEGVDPSPRTQASPPKPAQ